jgi:hypothetical protein
MALRSNCFDLADLIFLRLEIENTPFGKVLLCKRFSTVRKGLLLTSAQKGGP